MSSDASDCKVLSVSQSKKQERLSRIDSCDSSWSETNVSPESSKSSSRSVNDNNSRERSRAESHSYDSRTHDKHGARKKSNSNSKERSGADRKSHVGKTGGKHSERKNLAAKVEIEAELSAAAMAESLAANTAKEDNQAGAVMVANEIDAYATVIHKLMKKSETITRTIKHKIGVVRLLKKQQRSIDKDIKHVVSSSILLQFISPEKIVKVIGLPDDVSKAEDIIRNKYIKTICYGKHEICTPGLTKEMFRARHKQLRDIIDLIEHKHKCVIEVRGGGGQRSSGGSQPRAESPSETPSTEIEITSGNIVQFKADVLVNIIEDEGLEEGGVVLKKFLEAGAPKLQQDLQKLGIPKIFGTDVVATDAHGKLDAKFIFHAAIRKYQNQDSIEKLHNLIKKCLEMATERNVTTIAFPAVGSDRLAFDLEDVVECFVRAKQTTQTTIKIFIVAFDDHIHNEFKSHLSIALSETVERGLGHLYGTLDAAVNEVFLLHGTKKEMTDLINSDGLDSRICGNETMFGVGSYFAESSTKADQYADPVGNRVALGQPLYMYVCRVLLGKPHVCDDPSNVTGFKRPPCTQKDCHKDKCAHPPVARYDSIIGTHRTNPQKNGRLLFREFVIFHPDQSYPDFLVEFERVKYP